MDQKVVDFLEKERVCALTTLLADGAPHVSTMVFGFKKEPMEIYFLTQKASRKCALIQNGTFVKASVAFGFSESEMVTVQMDGEIRHVKDPTEIEVVRQTYLSKYPDHKRYDNEGSEYLVFRPTWWRYTDFKPVPNYIISSQ